MNHKKTAGLVTALLIIFAATAVLTTPLPVFSQPTIPTITPKPQPTNPPPKPTSDNGGGGGKPSPTDPPPQPTSVPVQPTNPPLPPAPTATDFAVIPVASPTAGASPTPTTAAPIASPTIAILATAVAFPPDATPFPTAQPCALPPTFQPNAAITVYAGPGSAYPPVGLLAAAQARPIVGRAAFVPWWVIQLDSSGRIGWVSDIAGTVQGSTGRVSIMSAPDLNGAVPTPGADPWVPTPNPTCATVSEGAAEVAPAEPIVNLGTETAPPSNQPQVESIPGALPSGESSAATAGDLDLSGETSARRGRGDVAAAADQLVAELAAEAEPLEIAPAPSAPNYLPIAGIVLIVAAIIVGVFIRRGSGSAPR
jgi:hypothetical protein